MRILVTTKNFHASGHQVLAEHGAEVRIMDQFESTEALEKVSAEFDPHGIISRTIPLTARAIDAAPSLRVIAKTGVGYDNIDLAAATRRRIPVLISFQANAASVAEHALGLMFALARNIARHDASIRAGEWSRFFFKAHELNGKRLGLVGFGQSAQHLMRMALGIGMEVSVFAPRYRYEKPPPNVAVATSLHGLLADSDIVSLHCPLTADTRGMIDAAAVAAMRRGAWLVNTARGPIVDEAALIEGLRTGQIGSAALDTYTIEPIARDHPLCAMGNVVLTPHVAGTTLQAAARAHPVAANNIFDVLEGRPLNMRAVVNPEVLPSAPDRQQHARLHT